MIDVFATGLIAANLGIAVANCLLLRANARLHQRLADQLAHVRDLEHAYDRALKRSHTQGALDALSHWEPEDDYFQLISQPSTRKDH